MPEKTWKKRERQVAAFFGSHRTPLSGGNGRQTRSDSLHPILFIEQKHRRSHAVLRVWDQARDRAKAEGKVPVVTLTESGREGFWILLHCDDAEDVLGQVLDRNGIPPG